MALKDVKIFVAARAKRSLAVVSKASKSLNRKMAPAMQTLKIALVMKATAALKSVKTKGMPVVFAKSAAAKAMALKLLEKARVKIVQAKAKALTAKKAETELAVTNVIEAGKNEAISVEASVIDIKKTEAVDEKVEMYAEDLVVEETEEVSKPERKGAAEHGGVEADGLHDAVPTAEDAAVDIKETEAVEEGVQMDAEELVVEETGEVSESEWKGGTENEVVDADGLLDGESTAVVTQKEILDYSDGEEEALGEMATEADANMELDDTGNTGEPDESLVWQDVYGGAEDVEGAEVDERDADFEVDADVTMEPRKAAPVERENKKGAAGGGA